MTFDLWQHQLANLGQLIATEYLEECGFTVDAAGYAAEAMNKLGLVPGGVDAMIVDMGLPDRRGDALIREVRVLYPSLAIVLATGLGEADLRKIFKNEERLAFVLTPYTRDNLLNALRQVGVRMSEAR